MNFAALLKTFDAVMTVADVARRVKGDAPPRPSGDGGMTRAPAGGGIGGQSRLA